MSIVTTDRPRVPQRSREVVDRVVLLDYGRVLVLACAAGLAIACAATLAWPVRYAATARVMLPHGASPGSRILKLEQVAHGPQAAVAALDEKLEPYLLQNARLIDAPTAMVLRPNLGLNLALGGGAGLLAGLAWLAARWRKRVPRLRPRALHELCAQLLEQWFAADGQLLAIVSAEPGEGRSSLAAQLAVAFAALGKRTLLVDGDLRAPRLHRLFNLPNAQGLGDLLEDGRVSLARAGENLSVMVAGSPRADPLELLSRSRLPAFLAEARRHFHVVLIDTPAAARAPDFQMFAALAGGALLLDARGSRGARASRGLHATLQGCGARLVATVGRQEFRVRASPKPDSFIRALS